MNFFGGEFTKIKVYKIFYKIHFLHILIFEILSTNRVISVIQ